TAVIGAAIAEFIGFNYTFALVGLMSIIGCIILLWLEAKNAKLGKIHSTHYHRRKHLRKHQ
ncbi:hypothetical protein KY310_03590, partial [Candidatus Woesearchaeota archaeon]|nr:hypothetical protein [Candidatus Woesearchaeota archaeon]